MYVSQDDKVVAYYALLDTPKSEAKDMIAFFKANGVHTIMITGDNEATGQTIGKQLGVDEIRANCLPEDKTKILKDLQSKYKLVGMVGDGVNDAPCTGERRHRHRYGRRNGHRHGNSGCGI
ncbi:MAG: HAD-IC family P-type ATPase [Trichococcus flocculiformis]